MKRSDWIRDVLLGQCCQDFLVAHMWGGEREKLNATSGSDWKHWVDGGAIYGDGDN